ncbi:hypothetical protein AABD35_13000 [Staphylococcus xylosus]|uniref:hypothetical protein n=1 Tax=Staphylococcus xylosus TaxID=1288 RepID=UPI00398B2147
MGRSWTDEEIKKMKSMLSEGKSNKYMGENLNRSQDSVRLEWEYVDIEIEKEVKSDVR